MAVASAMREISSRPLSPFAVTQEALMLFAPQMAQLPAISARHRPHAPAAPRTPRDLLRGMRFPRRRRARARGLDAARRGRPRTRFTAQGGATGAPERAGRPEGPGRIPWTGWGRPPARTEARAGGPWPRATSERGLRSEGASDGAAP